MADLLKTPVTPERKNLRADSVIGTQSDSQKSNSTQRIDSQVIKEETSVVTPTKTREERRRIFYSRKRQDQSTKNVESNDSTEGSKDIALSNIEPHGESDDNVHSDVESDRQQVIEFESDIPCEKLLDDITITKTTSLSNSTSTYAIGSVMCSELDDLSTSTPLNVELTKQSTIEVATTKVISYGRLEQLIQHKTHQHTLFKEKIFTTFPLDIAFRQAVDDKRCIGTTGPQRRCNKNASNGRVKLNVEECLKKLKDNGYEAEYDMFAKVLGRMEDPILCGTHRNLVAKYLEKCIDQLISTYEKEREWLKLELQQALQYWASEVVSPGTASVRKGDPISNETGIQGESTRRRDLQEHIYQLLALLESPSRVQTMHIETQVVKLHQERLQRFNFGNFIPARVKRFKSKPPSLEEHLKELIIRPLSSDEAEKSGYAYVFTFELAGFNGRYKIGIAQNPKDRVNGDWATHYQQKPRMVWNELDMHDSNMESIRPIPHYKRLEKLILGELREYNYYQVCTSGCQHIEWVEATEDHIVAVVQKWCKWMRQRPYKFGRTWTLKDEILNDKDAMEILCRPITVSQERKEKIIEEAGWSDSLMIADRVREKIVHTEVEEIKTVL